MSSPTQRSLKELRRLGWTCQVVEKWIPQARRRVDLFGCIDLVAMGGGRILGFQVTTTSNQAARVAKIKAEPRAREWLENGARLLVHGWLKSKKNGRWKLTETEIELKDFAEGPCKSQP